MEPAVDADLSALRRLLAEASLDGQAKAAAIGALSRRAVRVATWMPAHDGFRTVVDGEGASALPVFTGTDELRRAAWRFRWSAGDGAVSFEEISALQALRYVVRHDLSFLVVDIAATHALAIEARAVARLLG